MSAVKLSFPSASTKWVQNPISPSLSPSQTAQHRPHRYGYVSSNFIATKERLCPSGCKEAQKFLSISFHGFSFIENHLLYLLLFSILCFALFVFFWCARVSLVFLTICKEVVLPISHIAVNCGQSARGNPNRGAWSVEFCAQREGLAPFDNEVVSLNASELDSASLHFWQRSTFQKGRNLPSVMEEWDIEVTELPGVIGEGAQRKKDRGTWDLLADGMDSVARKSDGLIVAMKQGNACVAKGPDCSVVYNEERRPA